MRLAAYEFDIPQRYLLENGQGKPTWLDRILGLDDGTRELLLTVPASEVASQIPGFKSTDGNYDDDLRLHIVALTDEEKYRHVDPSKFSDLWFGTGSYRDRVVEKEFGTDYVRVYRRVEYPYSWEVLTAFPGGPIVADLFSFWIGHCLESRSSLTTRGALALCKSYTLIENVVINYTVSGQNLAKTESIRDYLRRRVTQWIRK